MNQRREHKSLKLGYLHNKSQEIVSVFGRGEEDLMKFIVTSKLLFDNVNKE